jgi:diguanylate cyclase (GGDEF)-like protein
MARQGSKHPRGAASRGALFGAAASLLGTAGFAAGGGIGAVLALALAALAGFLLASPYQRGGSGSPDEAKAGRAAPSPDAVTVPLDSPVVPEDRIDPLTGLANENGLLGWFAERAPRYIEDEKGIIVLSAALEGFEEIQRTRGQSIADQVLIEVAKRVAVFGTDEGVAARTGGGEFASMANVVGEDSLEVAADWAAKLTEMLQRPVELSQGVIWIGAMVGAASGPASEGLGILARARAALARAKPLGPGQYIVDGL